MSDFTVSNRGTIWLFTPQTDDAKAFCEERLGIESWQWLGTSFGVDHRPARDLVNFIEAEGLSVED